MVFHPSHRPLEIAGAIPTFPQPDDDDTLLQTYKQQNQGDTSTGLKRGTFLLGYDNWSDFAVRFCLTNPGGFSRIYTRRSPEENLTAVVQPHEPLVAALRSRERQAIAEAVREHIELSYGRYISSDGRAVKSFRDAEACRRRNRRFPEVD